MLFLKLSKIELNLSNLKQKIRFCSFWMKWRYLWHLDRLEGRRSNLRALFFRFERNNVRRDEKDNEKEENVKFALHTCVVHGSFELNRR